MLSVGIQYALLPARPVHQSFFLICNRRYRDADLGDGIFIESFSFRGALRIFVIVQTRKDIVEILWQHTFVFNNQSGNGFISKKFSSSNSHFAERQLEAEKQCSFRKALDARMLYCLVCDFLFSIIDIHLVYVADFYPGIISREVIEVSARRCSANVNIAQLIKRNPVLVVS